MILFNLNQVVNQSPNFYLVNKSDVRIITSTSIIMYQNNFYPLNISSLTQSFNIKRGRFWVQNLILTSPLYNHPKLNINKD